MTAAVVSMPTTSAFEAAFGGGGYAKSNSNKSSNKSSSKSSNSKNSNPDVLERFFAGWEAAFCGAPRSIQTLATEAVEEPGVLEYVFEHVESFTCTDDRSLSNDPFSHNPQHNQHNHNPHNQHNHNQHAFYEKGNNSNSNNSFDLQLRRENSLLEEGPNGAPTYLATVRTRRDSQSSLISKLGEEGDLLDYCFEHVESYVCTEGMELVDDKHYHHHHKGNNNKHHTQKMPMRNTTNQQQQQQQQQHYNGSSNVNVNVNRSSTYSPESSHPIPRVISTSTTRSKKKKRRQKQNYYPDEEDNILLYYRPTKTD